MNAPFHNLQPHDNLVTERRRQPRSRPAAPVMLSMAGRDPQSAVLSDVSAHGCCVKTDADWLRPGRFVALSLPSGDALSCLVRWTCGGAAGLELLQPAMDREEWRALID